MQEVIGSTALTPNLILLTNMEASSSADDTLDSIVEVWNN